MATQEESQFDDAFEDAESDHQNMKVPKGLVLQANGHLGQGNDDINGDLPESESAELEYQTEDNEQNGNMDNGDEVEGYDEYYDEAQYQDEKYQGYAYGDDGYHDDDGGHYDDDQYEEDVEDNQYYDDNQYEEEEDPGDGYVEENQYYEEEQDEESQNYIEEGTGDTQSNSGETEQQFNDREAEEEGGKIQEEEEQQEETSEQEDIHEGDIDESNEYAEDDAYSHDRYVNEKEDSPPEDASESDQFIDNPDIDEFRPASSPVSYSYHHPPETLNEPEGQYEDSGIVSGGNSTDHGTNAHHSDTEFDIPNQSTVVREEATTAVDYLAAEEDSKNHAPQLVEKVSVPDAAGSHIVQSNGSDKGLGGIDLMQNLTSDTTITQTAKIESDSAEADQQREDVGVRQQSEEVDILEPSRSSATVPSKTGSLKDQKRPGRPDNSMQYKESKELESILHSNLDALTSQKPKVEEETKKVEPDQGRTRQKQPNQAIPKHQQQGPPKSAQLVSQKVPKGPMVKSNTPRTKVPGGPRRQVGPRPARGRGHPEGSRHSGGPKEHPPSSKVAPAKSNQGRRPQRGPGTGIQRGGAERQVESLTQSPGKVQDSKGPGSAKPVSELKSLVQRTRQEILDLDKMLASTGNSELDEQERHMAMKIGPQRSNSQQQQKQRSHRRSSEEYASPSHMMGKGQADQELRYAKHKAGLGVETGNYGEQPRNNSNGNHLHRSAGSNRKGLSRRPHSSYFPSMYSRNIEESLVSTPGEVVFDDIAECNAYLQEKEYSLEQRAKSEGGHLQRRRRNSYEMANRDSSEEEEEDPYNSFLPSASPTIDSQNTHQNVIPLQRSNHEVFARLEDDYGADDSGNADDHPDSTQPSVTSDVSTPSTPGSQSTGSDPKSKLPSGINPLEYDVVGLRLAGHVDDSSVSISSMSTQPVPDQFSDADEEEEDNSAAASGPQDGPLLYQPPRRVIDMVTTTKDRILPAKLSPTKETTGYKQQPSGQVDIGKTMEELKSISTSKTAQLKTPTFYIDKSPSPWVLQPDVAMEQEEQDRIRRMKIEMKRK